MGSLHDVGRDYFGDLRRAGLDEADIERAAPDVWRRHTERFTAMWRSDPNHSGRLPYGAKRFGHYRTPLKRKQYRTSTPEAVEAFKRRRAARDGSKKWWEAHHVLHAALRLPPWVFPFDGSDNVPLFPLDRHSERTGELWRELEAAVGRLV